MGYPIIVWQIEDAPAGIGLPEDFFCTHGGDEDWVAEVHESMVDDSDGKPWAAWMGDGTEFARCDLVVKRHPLKPGWKIAVGGHA